MRVELAGVAISAALLAAAPGCGGDEAPEPAHPPMEAAPAAEAAENRAPVVRDVRISPRDPSAGATLRAVVDAADPDGDPVRLTYTWRRNGDTVGHGPELRLTRAEKGDAIEVEAVARDGRLESRPVYDRVELANRPPELLAVELTPEGMVEPGSVIRALPDARDPDGDPLAFDCVWRVNGEERERGGRTFSTEALERGDRVSALVVASDGEERTRPVESPYVVVGNAPPEIVSRPPERSADGVFRYAVEARDPDGDRNLRFRLLEAPEGMTIDPVLGTITWRPSPDAEGRIPVDLAVDDQHGGTSAQSFVITVAVEPGEEEVSPPPAGRAD